ncbi:MAG: hypothetical protein ACRD27_03095, partial [Terracidiphilus sp.]
LFACAAVCAVQAQVVDTSVCDILKNPASFNGKMVRVKATVSVGFDQFIVRGKDCGQPVDGIWLAYPPKAKGKAGPDAVLKLQPAHNFAGKYTAPSRTPVTLQRDKEFKHFDSLLAETHNGGAGMCLGCARYMVSATLVGRLDGVADATLTRDASGKIVGFGGFGNLNAYPARLVLQSVSDVTPKEVDYSKSDAATKGETQTFGGSPDLYDPMAAAQKMAAMLGSSQAGVQAQKDAATFGKPGEHNGVIVTFGSGNEASPKEEELGSKDSPDGVLFNCTFNDNRLQGDAETKAILHMGQHISELRDPAANYAGAPLSVLEFNAWAITATAAMGTHQKFLTLPGGYLVWDASWPAAERTQNFSDALKNFLANEALLSR